MLTRRLIRAYALYTLGFLGFVLLMWRIERATGSGVWIGYVFLFVPIAVYAVIGCCRARPISSNTTWPGGACRLPSTDGDRGRLAVGRIVHRPAGSLYATGYDARLRDGLDGRVLPRRVPARALCAQARALHDSRFSRDALEYGRARAGGRCGDPVFVRYARADPGDRPDRDALHRRRFRDRDFLRRGHSRVFVSRRDARGHVDAGRAVHHPDQRDPDSGFADRDEERPAPCRSSITAS